jgi:hypothetical protein
MSQYPTPQYRSPKQIAAQRAYMIRTIIWLALIPPVIFLVMVFGYSDQAPQFLRDFTVQLDGLFGRPVWSILAPSK